MLKTVSTQLALASDTLPEVLAKGNTTGGTDLAVSVGDDITLSDNSKVIFGTGSDLQIYSDGTAGLIKVNTVYGLGDITITQSADNKGIAILDSTESGAFYLRHNAANTVISNNDTRDMILATNSFDRLILDGTTGDATFSGNIILGTSGSGIDFSATAGTGTSELLDDYEEGDWTPAMSGSGGSVGITYSARSGSYVKIGNQVTCKGSIVLSAKTSITGAVIITGFPFTTQNVDSVTPINWAYFANLGANTWTQVSGYMMQNNTQCFLGGKATAATAFSNFADADITATTRIDFVSIYFV